MDRPFLITARFSQGNLHLQLSGDFDGPAAGVLAAMLEKTAPAVQRVFCNTDRLIEVDLPGRDNFKSRLEKGPLDLGRVYFKGPRALDLAPQGSRVLNQVRPACGPRKCCSGSPPGGHPRRRSAQAGQA
jgi:hypothetical protein